MSVFVGVGLMSTLLAQGADPSVSVSSAISGPSFGEALVRMIVALVAVVVLLILTARYLPRLLSRLQSGVQGRGTPAKSDLVRMLSSLQLSPSLRLVVVEVDGRRMLLSVGPSGASLISRLGRDDETGLELLAGDSRDFDPDSSDDRDAGIAFAQAMQRSSRSASEPRRGADGVSESMGQRRGADHEHDRGTSSGGTSVS